MQMSCRSAASRSSGSCGTSGCKCCKGEAEVIEEWKGESFGSRTYHCCAICDVVYLKEKQERLEREQKEKEKKWDWTLDLTCRMEKEEEDEETKQMKEVMGFGGFGTTKKK